MPDWNCWFFSKQETLVFSLEEQHWLDGSDYKVAQAEMQSLLHIHGELSPQDLLCQPVWMSPLPGEPGCLMDQGKEKTGSQLKLSKSHSKHSSLSRCLNSECTCPSCSRQCLDCKAGTRGSTEHTRTAGLLQSQPLPAPQRRALAAAASAQL